MPKTWCFWTVVLEKTVESLLDCKEIQPVHPKGNQSWIFTGKTDAEAECPILWPPDWKNWLLEKTLMLEKIEGRRRRWRQRMRWLLTQWTWIWVNSGSQWWTGRPGVLHSMGSQRVGHDWATELNWLKFSFEASLVAQLVKNLPAMRETWVWSLGWEDPLEKGKATHSSILAWRIPWTV